MSPADERRLVCLSLFAIVLFFLVFGFIPTYLSALFFLVLTCVVCYKAEELELFGRLGLNPHGGLPLPGALRRWLPSRTFTGVPTAGGRNQTRADVHNSLASVSTRGFSGSAYRPDVSAFSDSTFSPRSILMGSYLGKAESPPGPARPAGGNLREHLRERLTRAHHGVPTPNRRLSFGDPVGSVGRFSIAPQRHYPLQQMGTSPVGVFPPAQWDSFRKKNVLRQRNTPAHSPVTVKIARPDTTATRSLFCNQWSPAEAVTSPEFEAQADPCSRETVLNVLRASRKRAEDEDEDDDDERACESGQKSKRRRNDSGGSWQSGFEPLMANGLLSQIVPKPGSLKRGMNVLVDESVVKRSRTSSVSSLGGCPASGGVSGSSRNPIRSSYSSLLGYPQRTLPSKSSSFFESSGSPQSQTPVRAAKKPREEAAAPSPNPVSAFTSDQTITETALGPGKWTSMPDPPVSSHSDSGGSGGKRKRKIQLVSRCRGDQITLPPPPELGYTISAKDMDMERKATLNQIQKDLEDSEPEMPVCGPNPSSDALPVSLFLPVVSSVSAAPVESSSSLASLSIPAAVLSPSSSAVSTIAPAQTIDLTVTPSSTASGPPIQTLKQFTPNTSVAEATSAVNPLLESLKSTKSSFTLGVPSFVAATSAATSTAPATPSSVTSTTLSFGAIKSEPSIATPQPLTPSAFAQILAQPLPSSSATPNLGGDTSFGFLPTTSAPTSSAPTAPLASNQSVSSTANPSTVFKPIFGPAMTPASTAEGKPTQTTFTPIFGNAINQKESSASSVPAPQSSTSLFGGVSKNQLMSSTVPSAVQNTQSPSLFGSQTNSSSVAASVSTASNPTPTLFGGLTNSHTMAATASSSSSSNTQNFTVSLFAGLSSQQPMTASVLSSTSSTPLFCGQTSSQPKTACGSSSSSTQSSTPSLFTSWSAAKSTTAVSSGISTGTTNTSSTNPTLQFGSLKQAAPPPAVAAAPPRADTQNTFTFGQIPAATTTFAGFGMASNKAAMTSNTPATQPTFGSSVFSSSTGFANPPAPSSVNPFAFGASVGGGTTVTPLPFGTPASTAAPTFGNSTQPAFGGASTGFAFGNTSAVAVSAAPVVAPTFTFGAAPATPQNTATSGGFNFTAAASGAQFGTPAPAAQKQGFSFAAGNTENKPAFGASTPAFGTASGPIPFGSPGTPIGAFGASAFGTPSATFSIGSGSKPSSSRQRLARRQHTRKK